MRGPAPSNSASLSLGPADQDRLTRTLRVTLSPLDFSSVDEWRIAVNRAVRELVGADMASFLLPVHGRPSLLSEEFDPGDPLRYPARGPDLPCGDSIWERQARLRVWNRETLYRCCLEAYLRGEYYNELVLPTRAHDAMGVTVPVQAGAAAPERLAGLLLHSARRDGAGFGERGLHLLTLVAPAFESGVLTWVRWMRQREGLLALLDALAEPLLLLDVDGRELHRNRMLRERLSDESERERLLREMHEVARAVRGCLAPGSQTEGAAREVVRGAATERRRYRLRGGHLSEGALDGKALILVSLEQESGDLPGDAALAARFALTRREAQVARLVARGHANGDIARRLFVSPHTARHHVEQVLLKLGVHSRAEVAAALLGLPRIAAGAPAQLLA